MVVWCIPGDDVGVLHASALFVERKFPDASQQPDKAQNCIREVVAPNMRFKTRMCLLKWCLHNLESFHKSSLFFGSWLYIFH